MAFKQLKLWFDEDCAQLFVDKLQTTKIKIDKNRFIKEFTSGVEPLELKDRIEFVCDLLKRYLPGEYIQQLAILMDILGPENTEETGMFKIFYWVMPVAKFVEKYGIEHYSESIQAIEEITKRNTGEFTIRPYILKYPNKTIAQMKTWAISENVHLRRLASEGMRTRLPWASKFPAFIENPKPVIEILEILKDDPSKFVQNSVANSLNDIFKDNEAIAMNIVNEWKINPSVERAWIIRHAIRNYRKKKVAWALELTEAMKKIK